MNTFSAKSLFAAGLAAALASAASFALALSPLMVTPRSDVPTIQLERVEIVAKRLPATAVAETGKPATTLN